MATAMHQLEAVTSGAAHLAAAQLGAIADALCPLVTDAALGHHAGIAQPVVDAVEPYATAAGVPDYQLFNLVFPAFLYFSSIYFAGHLFFTLMGVKGAERALFASCAMSMMHGATTTVFAGAELCRQHPDIDYGMKNNHEQEIILQYSTGYFIADLVVYMIPNLADSDVLFILHHFTTSGYMLWSLKIGYGAISSIMLMFLGEATSVFFNPWLGAREWLKFTNKKSAVAGWLFEIFTYPYSILFIIIRGIIGPVVLFDMCAKLIASESLGDMTKYTWVTMITLAFLGSLIWVKKLAIGFSKHMLRKVFGSGKSEKGKVE